MRILILDRYFWPDDAPHSEILKQIAQWLDEDGHTVSVLTAQPSYVSGKDYPTAPEQEMLDSVFIRRVRLLRERRRGLVRHLNNIAFSFVAFLTVLFKRDIDVVFAQSTPPVLQAFAISLAAMIRRRKFIYHVHDVHPELARAMGLMRENALFNFFLALDNFSLRQATAVVPLARDMEKTLRQRATRDTRFLLINNFAPFRSEKPPAPRQRNGDKPLRFIFAGNIGHVQGLEKLVDAFADVPPDIATLEFIGGGAAKDELIEQAERLGADIKFSDPLPADEAFRYLQEFDVGVVALAPDIIHYAFPSKTATYLAAGLKLLTIVETDSELAKAIEQLEIGAAVSPRANAGSIGHKVVDLTKSSIIEKPLPAIADQLFDAESIRQLWLELFRSIDTK